MMAVVLQQLTLNEYLMDSYKLLEFAFFGLIFLYICYQYKKQEPYHFNIILLSFILFAMMGLDVYIRFFIVVVLFSLVKFKQVIVQKNVFILFIFSFILFIFTGGVDPILEQLKSYVFKENITFLGSELHLHFYTVMQTVREASSISFETFANRISGHILTFIVGIIGYIWLLLRHPVMLLSLPMIGLGFLSYTSGLRFTIYAVPVISLGVGFFIVEISKFLQSKRIQYSTMILLVILTLLPNINHIINYKVPTVFIKDEVQVLDRLKYIVSRDDYVVSWWDYGYPIRYYSNVKTLSDGGKHSGAVNFPISFALTHSQEQAAKILRLDVEYTEKKIQNSLEKTNIANMTLDYGFKDTNDFLESLKYDIKLPQKTREIYLYLPNQMINIFTTINKFSNIDLMSGKKGQEPLFYFFDRFKEYDNIIDLGNNIEINKIEGTLKINEVVYSINNFVKTFYDKNNNLQIEKTVIDKKSDINLIYMSNYEQFLIVNNNEYNSTYVQLFILENYDVKLFEPVILTPLAKVYKLKV